MSGHQAPSASGEVMPLDQDELALNEAMLEELRRRELWVQTGPQPMAPPWIMSSYQAPPATTSPLPARESLLAAPGHQASPAHMQQSQFHHSSFVTPEQHEHHIAQTSMGPPPLPKSSFARSLYPAPPTPMDPPPLTFQSMQQSPNAETSGVNHKQWIVPPPSPPNPEEIRTFFQTVPNALSMTDEEVHRFIMTAKIKVKQDLVERLIEEEEQRIRDHAQKQTEPDPGPAYSVMGSPLQEPSNPTPLANRLRHARTPQPRDSHCDLFIVTLQSDHLWNQVSEIRGY